MGNPITDGITLRCTAAPAADVSRRPCCRVCGGLPGGSPSFGIFEESLVVSLVDAYRGGIEVVEIKSGKNRKIPINFWPTDHVVWVPVPFSFCNEPVQALVISPFTASPTYHHQGPRLPSCEPASR